MLEEVRTKLRTAYFKGKLNKALDEIVADNALSEEDVREIDQYLSTLQEEKKKNDVIAKRYDGSIDPPETESLLRLSDEDRAALNKWLENTKETITEIKNIMNGVRTSIKKGNKPKRDEWLDYGLSVITLMFSLDQYEIVYNQLYRAELTRLIDDFGISRAEAQERAKLTPEYREYKKAQRLREAVLEFEMMCKKYAGLE